MKVNRIKSDNGIKKTTKQKQKQKQKSKNKKQNKTKRGIKKCYWYILYSQILIRLHCIVPNMMWRHTMYPLIKHDNE